MTDTDPTAATPELSIIISTRDGADLLRQALDCLVAQVDGGRVEVIVVDDGSTDETPHVLSEFAHKIGPALVWIALGHVGSAASRNAGAARARGRWLLFVDNDVRVPPRFCNELLYFLMTASAEEVWGFADHPCKEDSYMAHSLRYLELASRAMIERDYPIKSAAMLLRGSAFRALGGFDPSLGYYRHEDTNLLARSREAGMRLRYSRQPWVYHRAPTLHQYIVKRKMLVDYVNVPRAWVYYRVPHSTVLLTLTAVEVAIGGVSWRWAIALGLLDVCILLIGSGLLAIRSDAGIVDIPGIMAAVLIRLCLMPIEAALYLWRAGKAMMRRLAMRVTSD